MTLHEPGLCIRRRSRQQTALEVNSRPQTSAELLQGLPSACKPQPLTCSSRAVSSAAQPRGGH